jgi:hypothetical protein
MFIVTREGVYGDANAHLRLLQALLADLERIAAGYRPGAELIGAPFLDSFLVGVRPTPCLWGDVQGHPTCHGPAVQTSDLWAFAPDLGWARTYSRYYRLGRPADLGGHL